MNKPKKQPNKWLIFINIPFQMGIIIGIGVYAGLLLDEKFNTQPILLVIFSLLSIVISFYTIIKQIQKLNNDK